MDICICEKFESFAVAKYWIKLRGIRKRGCRGCDSGMTACVAVMDGPGGNVFHSCCSPSACGGPAWLRQQAAEPATSCLPRMMSVQALAPQQTQCWLHRNTGRGQKSTSVLLFPFIGLRKVLEHLRPPLPCLAPLFVRPPCAFFSLSLAAFIFPRTQSAETKATHCHLKGLGGEQRRREDAVSL